MCKCTPSIRTPYCGKPGCVWPGADAKVMDNFINAYNDLSREVVNAATMKGFHKEAIDEGRILMLIVSELAEACEWLRLGNPLSSHIPKFSGVEEELADVIIRVMDYGAMKGYRVAEAIRAKIEFNRYREFLHGGKRF